MNLLNRPSCITDRDIRFMKVSSPEAENTPWGQFDRIERARQDQARRNEWQQTIDRVFIEWGRHPENIEDDGLEPPTPRSIAAASRFACILRDEGAPVPTHVAPNGDGGVVLHFEDGSILQTIEIDDAGHYDWRVLRDGRLISRRCNPL